MSEITPMDEANRVHIFDTTLRDGEQAPGIAMDSEEKLEIARQLVRVGVDVIEAGFPINSRPEFVAVQGIARTVQEPVICALARAASKDLDTADIDTAWRAIQDARRPRIHTFISTSDIHIVHQMDTTREAVKNRARVGVARAKELCEDVEFSPMDATRADIEYTAEVCAIAIEEGATTINVPDTVGYAVPEEMGNYIRQLQILIPAIGEKGVMLSVHCHDDLDLATANALAGLQAGARQVELSVNGIGERAGNGDIAPLVMALRKRRNYFGLDTTINTQELGPASRLVAGITGYDIPNCKAVNGLNAHRHEAGIHAVAEAKYRGNFSIMDPAEVGMDPETIVLGKHSGKGSVKHVLEVVSGYDPKFFAPTFELFHDIAGKVGKISPEQLSHIHREAKRRETAEFKLQKCDILRTNEMIAATVTISGGAKHSITAQASSGRCKTEPDGPVDAIFSALQKATDTCFELDNYKLKALGEGQRTIGLAKVMLNVGSKKVMGQGLSTDTFEATAWAYIDALTKAILLN